MRHVRSLALLPLLAAFLLTLGGCFEMEETMVLRKDGTGTMTLKMVLDTKKMEQVKQMMDGMFGGGGGGMDQGPISAEDFDIEKAKEKVAAIEGLRLVKSEAIEDVEHGKRGMLMVVEFQSLEAMAKSGLWNGEKVALTQGADGAWSFVVQRVPDEAMEQMKAPEAEQMKPMLEGMFGPFMEGLSMKTTWVLPGTAGTTNGKLDEEGQVVWAADWKALFGDPSVMNRSVTFRGEGLALKAFEHKSSEVADAMAHAGGMGGTDDDMDDAEETEEVEDDAVPSGR